MFRLSTISIAKAACDTVQYRNFIITPKQANTPIGVMYEHYRMSIEPTFQTVTTSDAVAIKQAFGEFNKNMTDMAESEFNELVSLTSMGLRRMVTNIRTNVAPFISTVQNNVRDWVTAKATPDVKIEDFTFHPIHTEQGLVEHVLNNYNDVRQLDAYRTFLIDYPGPECVVEWISKNNHVASEVVGGWFAGLDPAKVRDAWEGIFRTDRTIKANHGVFDKLKLPYEIDYLLLIYFLTIYLSEEPQDVYGESVSLEEWQETMRILHRYAGALLSFAYQKRISDVKRGVLVYAYHQPELYNDRYMVTVNGELVKEWLSMGGDIKQIFGALVSNPSLKTIQQLDEKREELIREWDRKYYMLKQIAQDSRIRLLKNGIVNGVISTIRHGNTGFTLPETLSIDEVERRLKIEVGVFKESDYDDINNIVKTVICHTIYPNTPFLEYLNAMEKAAKEMPELKPREASLIALIDLMASWLSKQLDVRTVELDYGRDNERSDAPVALNDIDQSDSEPAVIETPDSITSQSEELPVVTEVAEAPLVDGEVQPT